VSGPSLQSIRNYACHTLALTTFFDQPGDGRTQPRIPAADLSWALLVGGILRLGSAHRLEWLANFGHRKDLGLSRGFGDDALAYFSERVDPDVIRRRLAETLKLAKSNKVFEEAAFIGLAVDGTGVGHTTRTPCPLCHPIKDAGNKIPGHNHTFVMISVVGAGITLPFDVEPYPPGDSEYAAGQRLLQRAVSLLGPRFASYVVADAKFATAPFLHCCDQVGLPVIARLKQNLPELSAAVEASYGQSLPTDLFLCGNDSIESWDAAAFNPWEALHWPAVRVLRYRQHKKDGPIVQADWLTNFPSAKLPTRSFFKLAKSRWEIENQGFNDAKNLYGMEHIQHHHPNSMLVNWLFLLLAVIVERLYRLRYLHRGSHRVLTAMQLKDTLWLSLRPAGADSG
jgi:hypothetical protein